MSSGAGGEQGSGAWAAEPEPEDPTSAAEAVARIARAFARRTPSGKLYTDAWVLERYGVPLVVEALRAREAEATALREQFWIMVHAVEALDHVGVLPVGQVVVAAARRALEDVPASEQVAPRLGVDPADVR